MKLKNIAFAKYSGTSNDFILIDNRKDILKGKDISKFTIAACRPKSGIGADGVILLEKSRNADFKMRIINPDASEAEMCGNGARCVAHFANAINFVKKKMTFETIAGMIEGEVKSKNIIKVKLTDPFGFKKDIKIKYKGKDLTAHFINTGVPHTVLFVSNLEKADVFNIGRFIRYHKLFQKAGTNVNFVQVTDRHNIIVRTYERGVENETLACGTGMTASSLISSVIKKTVSPVRVKARSGEYVSVYFNCDEKGNFSRVYLEGEVLPVFSGITRFNGKNILVE
ncbi:MAG: diaminopimelate epimerase [Spirochaetes bacterium]|nr:diaminopimelate epimerase [Spirochaetota bacterium]